MSEKITLADQIYADIKKDITNKQLVSGEKINIKELARKYGVSDRWTASVRMISGLIVWNSVWQRKNWWSTPQTKA